MVKVAVPTTLEAEAKTLKIYCKVSDRFTASLEAADGRELFDQEDGYVPSFMPGDHYGDYIILDIDLATGQIINWKEPSAAAIEKWMKGAD
jgi:hypothetical protein